MEDPGMRLWTEKSSCVNQLRGRGIRLSSLVALSLEEHSASVAWYGMTCVPVTCSWASFSARFVHSRMRGLFPDLLGCKWLA